MPSIGAVQFITVSVVDKAESKVADVTRPNVDGRALRKTGKQGDRFIVRATKDVIAADGPTLSTEIDVIKSLQGTILTIVDDNGISRLGIAVDRVGAFNPKKIIGAVGGLHGSSATHMIKLELVCVDTSA